MDPDSVLAELRMAIALGDARVAMRAAADLDEWLSKGGWPPKAWLPPDMVRPYVRELER